MLLFSNDDNFTISSFLFQELRSLEAELSDKQREQRMVEERLRQREAELAEREIDLLQRELNIMIQQGQQEVRSSAVLPDGKN